MAQYKNRPTIEATSKEIRAEILDRKIWMKTIHLTVPLDSNKRSQGRTDWTQIINKLPTTCEHLHIHATFTVDSPGHFRSGCHTPSYGQEHEQSRYRLKHISLMGQQVSALIQKFPHAYDTDIRLSAASGSVDKVEFQTFSYWVEVGDTEVVVGRVPIRYQVEFPRRVVELEVLGGGVVGQDGKEATKGRVVALEVV